MEMVMIHGWLLVFFMGSGPVMVSDYPYATKEACVEAVHEVSPQAVEGVGFTCLRVEKARAYTFPQSQDGTQHE